MKLTKTQIKEKRSELVDVLLKIEKLKDQKTSIEKILAPDFETNEAACRKRHHFTVTRRYSANVGSDPSAGS
jgi:2-iminoacetate synthase ThiH